MNEYAIFVDVAQMLESDLTECDMKILVIEELNFLMEITPSRTISQFNNAELGNHAKFICIPDAYEIIYDNPEISKDIELKNGKSFPLNGHNWQIIPMINVYKLEEECPDALHIAPCGDDDEISSKSKYCVLPNAEFHGIWENLIFDDHVKGKLLDYAVSSVKFSKCEVNANIICWNRVILLYGPPGTGKTSLCKGLAQKLAIRLNDTYKQTEFIEINSHSLFSKYYSESGKLVSRMFSTIRQHLEYGRTLVCILIDEIESLTHARDACIGGSEPSDSIRVVNAVLTQLDYIRSPTFRYPNVLILTTSNLKSAIDTAFVDRADLKIWIGTPSTCAIVKIFESCFDELIRVGIIRKTDTGEESYSSIAQLCNGLSGRILRKIPFLAYSYYAKNSGESVGDYFTAIKHVLSKNKENEEHYLQENEENNM